MRILFYLLALSVFWVSSAKAQPDFSSARSVQSLNGQWEYIVDPYDNGYYSYRMTPRSDGFFMNKKPSDSRDLVEYEFNDSNTLQVPGDWNSQKPELFFYEGTVWYKYDFHVQKSDQRYFLKFGAVNYIANVYLNTKKVGDHEGGFTSFEFEVTEELKDGKNTIVVMVNNHRKPEYIPTVNTDWWNYGGITRDVALVARPQSFISDTYVRLDESGKNILLDIQVDGEQKVGSATLSIPELKVSKNIEISQGSGTTSVKLPRKTQLWSPENPKLYDITLTFGGDVWSDKVGLRTIETKSTDILLNGESVLLKGISIHEEAPLREGRAYHRDDARVLMTWAKELGCNFVRLAHYPHNEHMLRMADEMGLMVWSEVPVYWTIDFTSDFVLNKAKSQLKEMIVRDRNRSSIIIWSVANETPRGEARLNFLTALIDDTRKLDPSRLVSAATEIEYDGDKRLMDDELGNHLDVIGVNEYHGWYGGRPEDMSKLNWINTFDKPLFISEFGAGALQGLHGTVNDRWTEEYQVSVYENQVAELETIESLRGMSPWILKDFRSPRRPLYGIQDFWNRKGLISERGEKKDAFYTLRDFYYRWKLD